MNCKYVSQKIGSYIDGELPRAEMLAIRAHLHDCMLCAEEAESLCALKFELASIPCASVPDDLEERLLRCVRQDIPPKLSRRQIGFRWGTALAAASSAGFAIVWFGGMAGSASESEPRMAAGSSVPNEAFEVSQDQARAAAADPLGGHGLVVTTSYGQ